MTNTLPNWLSRQANVYPQQIALQASNGVFTYLALRETVNVASLNLSFIKKGNRVAVLVQDSLHFALCVHTLIDLEAILVPLNWRLTPAEMAWQVEDSGVSVLLFDSLQAAVAKTISGIMVEKHIELLDVGPLFAGTKNDESVESEQVEHRKDIQLDEAQAIIYTSGTTGRPKGAVLTYGNHWWGATASALGLGLDLQDKWLIPMPLFHVGGLAVLMRSLIYGSTAVLHAGFDAHAVSLALDEDQITLVSLVPTMLQRLLAERTHEFPVTLRAILLGGSGTPTALLQAALDRKLPIRQSYGLTEANSQVSTIRGEDATRKIGSAGKPLLSTQVKIKTPDGQPVNHPHIEGEIWVSGPTVSPGYWNRPDATALSFVDGWFRTGDMGYVDSEGFLYVLDRKSDIIISGGENIYPAEVEAAFEAHPAVLHCGVVGVEDSEWGQVPVAFVVFDESAEPTSDEVLNTFLGTRLAKYKIPKTWHLVSSLPRNASGKLLRKNLREWVKDL
jgi:o-succinylbenzoate---CoA ligase